MANLGILLQGVTTAAGLGFIWYLISRGERRSIKTGKSPGVSGRKLWGDR